MLFMCFDVRVMLDGGRMSHTLALGIMRGGVSGGVLGLSFGKWPARSKNFCFEADFGPFMGGLGGGLGATLGSF